MEIILLWLAIFVTILQFRKISKTASYLLFPYPGG
ncbi:MAG TPA: tryptophan-rich sensory protein [Methanosarcina sp.]